MLPVNEFDLNYEQKNERTAMKSACVIPQLELRCLTNKPTQQENSLCLDLPFLCPNFQHKQENKKTVQASKGDPREA